MSPTVQIVLVVGAVGLAFYLLSDQAAGAGAGASSRKQTPLERGAEAAGNVGRGIQTFVDLFR